MELPANATTYTDPETGEVVTNIPPPDLVSGAANGIRAAGMLATSFGWVEWGAIAGITSLVIHGVNAMTKSSKK